MRIIIRSVGKHVTRDIKNQSRGTQHWGDITNLIKVKNVIGDTTSQTRGKNVIGDTTSQTRGKLRKRDIANLKMARNVTSVKRRKKLNPGRMQKRVEDTTQNTVRRF